jgi:2',3'-cyclic-nucleotide 2'-phosphodiesterase/3'-nucleotidase
VILFGHTHRELSEKFIHSVLLVQAKNWGQSLAKVDIEMDRGAGGAWQVTSKHSATIPVTDEVPADPEILRLAERYHRATQSYLDTSVATSAKELDGSTARYEDHPLVDLIHKVQMEYGRADVSLATMFYPGARIPAGKVTVRQIAALYIYENTLYTVEMTGAQLKEALEHAASFFSGWPFRPGEPPRLPGYNADSAEGVSYTVDLSQPEGQRIRELTFKGKPLEPAAKLRVAINNYRYTGGGHYDVFKGLPVVYRSPQETRELIIEYVTRTGIIPGTADDNWRIVPREALEAILREAREREQAGGGAGGSR